MMTDKLKAAVVGVGTIGDRHAYAYHDYGRSELVLVCDTDEDRARELQFSQRSMGHQSEFSP